MSIRLPTAALALASLLACKAERSPDTSRAAGDTTAAQPAVAPADAPASLDAKVQEAMSAAPTSIAENATIMDWPEKAGGQPKELRHGTNGWTCFPSSPKPTGASGQGGQSLPPQSPMCLDNEFAGWGAAWMARKRPQMKHTGIAYMLRGDAGASNTDPYATSSTPDNEWVVSGPHVMVATPSLAQIEGITTDPKSGGPWVMWKGTPYAHIMVPVAGPSSGAR